MLKKLYDRCVELARHKFSKPLLGFVAFIESFFFPVPPDLMIIPMVVAKREDYLKIFLIALDSARSPKGVEVPCALT